MSEFKFACPVCGQHITADSNASGSQLSCPTCYRKIVVPQAPSSADPKFVLSAAEANKPKPPQSTRPAETPVPAPAKPAVSLGLMLLLILACAAGATLFVLRGKIFTANSPPIDETSTNTAVAHPPFAPDDTNSLWTLDLTNVVFPDTAASGRIHARDFTCDRATLQGGTLILRTDSTGPVELGLNIYFFSRQPEELSGKNINVTTNDPIAPRVILRWRDADQPVTEAFSGGYALRLEFGNVTNAAIPAKIFICLPDSARSYVAGTFNAEIRRPTPKSRPPKRRR